MSGSTLEVFEDYQKARFKFVQRVAELATRPQKIEELQGAGVMQLLRPLLLDIVSLTVKKASLQVRTFYSDSNSNLFSRCTYTHRIVFVTNVSPLFWTHRFLASSNLPRSRSVALQTIVMI